MNKQNQIFLISLTCGHLYTISNSRENVIKTLDLWAAKHLKLSSSKVLIKSIQTVDAQTIKEYKTKILSM